MSSSTIEVGPVAYVFLVGAIAAEVLGTSMLKATDGFTRLWPTLACLGSYAVAFALLARAVLDVPVGIAYAMWAGLGTVAIVGIAAAFLGEPVTPTKVIGVALVVAGVVILNLDGAH